MAGLTSGRDVHRLRHRQLAKAMIFTNGNIRSAPFSASPERSSSNRILRGLIVSVLKGAKAQQ